MEAETDREVEYERLRDGLIWDEVDGFARSLHAARRHVDGSPKLTHLYVVSELAGRYANRFYADADLFEQRYLCIVCRAAGLLHEAMAAGADFEALVDASDEAVARLVAEVTPDGRLPWPQRVPFFANQLGLASEPAQLLALADLQHNLVGLRAVASRPGADLKALRARAEAERELASSLGKIGRHPASGSALAALVTGLKDLEKQCRPTRMG